jgi:serine/threonine-protein kinase
MSARHQAPANRLGLLAVRAGLASEAQVREALAAQQAARGTGENAPPLGDLLVERGVVERGALEVLLAAQQRVGNKSVPFRVDLEGEARFGKFRVLRPLGGDADSLTYEAIHEETQHHVTLRVLRDRDDEAASQRFARNIRRASVLYHPNILRVFTAGRSHGHDYYATYYEPGRSLREILGTDGRLAPPRVADIGHDVADALAYAHERGVYHQELRPAFIIIAPDERVKVAGLGLIAEPIRDLERLLRVAGEVPSYIAPEQVGPGWQPEGRAQVDPRTDLYALGAILYHCLVGEPPFGGGSIAEVVQAMEATPDEPDPAAACPQCPPALWAVIRRLLQREPGRRFASAAALREALAPFLPTGTEAL